MEQYHKTTINIPLDIYNDMKRESKVLGINFNALLLLKLNKLKEQDNALDSLSLIAKSLQELNEKQEVDRIFKGVTKK